MSYTEGGTGSLLSCPSIDVTNPSSSNGALMSSLDDGTNNEFKDDRLVVENFVRRVAVTCSDCAVLSFLPWTSGAAPEGVLLPSTSESELDENQLHEVLKTKQIVIACCTFKFMKEQAAAKRIVDQLLKEGDVCILVAQLLPAGMEFEESNVELIMSWNKAISDLGVANILLDPDWNRRQLRLSIRMAHHTWKMNAERMHGPPLSLAHGEHPATAEELQNLENILQQLLFEDIPRELMRQFRPLDRKLVETDEAVGDYALGKRLATRQGCVNEAIDKSNNQKVVMKMVNKKIVGSPGEIEAINREFRFLTGFVRHPHIVRLLSFLHGSRGVYFIFEHAGDRNMTELLSEYPGSHLPDCEALSCFGQLTSALIHCHSMDISHRAICCNHLAVKRKVDGGLWVKLLDFRCAMVTKPGSTSVAQFGTLPCMSPEVLRAEPYLPKCADIWSAAVVLLEMAGGQGSFFKALEIDEDEIQNETLDNAEIARQIFAFVQRPDCHEYALACMNNVHSEDVLELLRCFLQPEQRRKAWPEVQLPERARVALLEESPPSPSGPAAKPSGAYPSTV